MPSPAVQSALARTSSTTAPTTSFGVLPAAGNGIVAFLTSWRGAGGTTHNAMSDNQGGTYVQVGTTVTVAAAAGDFIYESIWQRVNIGSPSGTFTVTATVGNASDCALAIAEYPLVTASPVDQNNSGTGSSTAPSVTLAATTNANDVIVALTTYRAGTTTITPDGTNLPNQLQENEDNNTGQAINVSDRQVAATGTYTANVTLGASRDWGIIAVALKLATGGSATKAPPPFQKRHRVWTRRITG